MYHPLKKCETRITSNNPTALSFKAPAMEQRHIDEYRNWAETNEMRLNWTENQNPHLPVRKELVITAEYGQSSWCWWCHKCTTTQSHLGQPPDLQWTWWKPLIEKRVIAVLKQAEVSTETLTLLYKTWAILTISHTAWFPFITKSHKTELRKCQMLALQIIFNDFEYYVDRLTAANSLWNARKHLESLHAPYRIHTEPPSTTQPAAWEAPSQNKESYLLTTRHCARTKSNRCGNVFDIIFLCIISKGFYFEYFF